MSSAFSSVARLEQIEDILSCGKPRYELLVKAYELISEELRYSKERAKLELTGPVFEKPPFKREDAALSEYFHEDSETACNTSESDISSTESKKLVLCSENHSYLSGSTKSIDAISSFNGTTDVDVSTETGACNDSSSDEDSYYEYDTDLQSDCDGADYDGLHFGE